MDKIYDVFAEQTRKQARIYNLERPKKAVTVKTAKPQGPTKGRRQPPDATLAEDVERIIEELRAEISHSVRKAFKSAG